MSWLCRFIFIIRFGGVTRIAARTQQKGQNRQQYCSFVHDLSMEREIKRYLFFPHSDQPTQNKSFEQPLVLEISRPQTKT
jgi:hypothetical protein